MAPTATATGPVWPCDAGRPRWPCLRADAPAELCVVGLGNSGLTAINAALDAGATVIGLDAGRVASGAAGRNGGFLLAGLPLFYHQAAARIGHARAKAVYRATLDELDRVAAAAPAAVRRTGSLRIATTGAELADCRAQAALLTADGFRAGPYQGPEGDGVVLHEDAVGDPLLRALTAAARAAENGAALYEDTPVIDVAPGRVRTTHGTVHCRAVVIAVDGGLERLLPALTGRVRTTRLQMLATAPVDRLVARRPVYVRYGFEYYHQLPDGRVALGGFRDRHADNEWGAPPEPSAAVQADLETYLREELGVYEEITHRWAGCVAYTEDHLPVLEEYAPGVHVAGAYCGLGNLLGSLCARAAAARGLGLDDPLAGLL